LWKWLLEYLLITKEYKRELEQIRSDNSRTTGQTV
jgi:hypothetical protein